MGKKITKTLKFIVILGFSGIVQAALNDDLIAYYSFNWNANNEVVNSNIVLESFGGNITSTQYVFKEEKGILIDNIPMESDGYTIELYFTFSTVRNYRKILDFGNLEKDFGLYINDGRLTLYGRPHYSNTISGNTLISSQEKIHVVFKRDNIKNNINVFLNGNLEISFNDTEWITLVSQVHLFMDDTQAGTVSHEVSSGALDYFRIYNTVLTDSEIQELYNEGSTPNIEESETSVAILSENLDIHIPQLRLHTDEANSSILDVQLKRVFSGSEDLTWKLDSYSDFICPTEVVECINDEQVAESYLNGSANEEPLNILLPYIKLKQQKYWANLKFIGKVNDAFTWKLKDYGEGGLLRGAKFVSTTPLSAVEDEKITFKAATYTTSNGKVKVFIQFHDGVNYLSENPMALKEGRNNLWIYERTLKAGENKKYKVIVKDLSGSIIGIQEKSITVDKPSLKGLTFQSPINTKIEHTCYDYDRNVPAFGGYHTGKDYCTKLGDPVYASNQGKVVATYSGNNHGFGNTVIIEHKLEHDIDKGKLGMSNSLFSFYAHLDSYNVKKGDLVKRGEPIAKVGRSGKGSGGIVHLHYELKYLNMNGIPNPDELSIGIDYGYDVNHPDKVGFISPNTIVGNQKYKAIKL